MKKLRTLIVDDEPLALRLLKSKLQKIGSIEIVGECKNGREAIEATLDLDPELLFLDIQMPGLNGLDVVKNLQNDVVPLVIFTTAYEQYALDAFDVHAVDYILKPLDDERIQRAVDRATQLLDSTSHPEQKPKILGAINHIVEKEVWGDMSSNLLKEKTSATSVQVTPKVVVKDRDEITILKQKDIEWVDAAGDYVCLHSNGKTHIKRSTLKELLGDLDGSFFKRIHRSTIVNLNYIERVIPHTKGEFFLELKGNERIKVSRNYKDIIKIFLSKP
jgi:two-component system LytT family response regulator